jgi:hypothetical protein
MHKKLVTILALAAIPLLAIAVPVSQALEAEFLCQQIPKIEHHIINQQRRSDAATSAFKIRFNNSYIDFNIAVMSRMVDRKIQLHVVCPKVNNN